MLTPELMGQLTLYNSVAAVMSGALNNNRSEAPMTQENITKLNDVLSQTLSRIQAIYNS